MSRSSYESVKCPMQGCAGDLYLTTSHSFPVYLDTQVGDFDHGNQITSHWQVECVAGHVVLLPISGGCAEESATFTAKCERCDELEAEDGGPHHNDYERLALLSGPVGVAAQPPLNPYMATRLCDCGWEKGHEQGVGECRFFDMTTDPPKDSTE